MGTIMTTKIRKSISLNAEPLPPVDHLADNKQCVVRGVYGVVLRVTSIFGLAPLSFKSRHDGYTVSLSKYMCIYGYLLAIILVVYMIISISSLATYGISSSDYISHTITKVIFTCDIVMVPMMAFIGIVGAPFRMRCMLSFKDAIASVDKSIGALYSQVNERNIWAALISVLLFYTALIVHNTWYFWMYTGNFRSVWEVLLHHFLWYQVIILDVQFSFTVMSVQRLLKAVNEALNLTSKQLNTEKSKTTGTVDISEVEKLSTELQPENSSVIVEKSETGEPRLVISVSDAVHRIANLHGSLCDVVHVINQCYSAPLIIILIFSLLHLIVTPYFTLLEISKQESINHLHFLVLEGLWMLQLVVRLFMVVEPCHYTVVEGKKTENLICHMLLVSPTSDPLSTRLELFSRQLMMQSLSYNPMGLCILDRPLIASILGVMTTYLVILIQFQGSSD